MRLRALPLLVLGLLGGAAFGDAGPGGAGDGDLPPCPGPPNCVSSRDPDPARRVEPFPLTVPAGEAIAALAKVVSGMERARVVSASGTALRAEFRTRLGFVDDVVFVVAPDGKAIHVRSASRAGYWDLGVNRRRLERIRAAFLAATGKGGAGGGRADR